MLRGYMEERALVGPTLPRRAGRDDHDHLARNIGIVCLVFWVCQQFGLRPARNREARRAQSPQSCGSSIVSAALGRCGFNITEPRVANIWGGLWGSLINHLLLRGDDVPVNSSN